MADRVNGETEKGFPQFRKNPALASVAAEVLWLGTRHGEPATFLLWALPVVAASCGANYLAWIEGSEGRWTIRAETGVRQSVPYELVAEAADQQEARSQGEWVAVGLPALQNRVQVALLRCGPGVSVQHALVGLEALAPLLAESLAALVHRTRLESRTQRLEAILDITQRWNQTRDLEPLLAQMAQAATRLLDCDRASIFLWDRRAHVLVGRPALGMEQTELRIADDRGVVGRVIQTGQPCRADARFQPELIDRRVDAQTGYRTLSVLCVPLRGRSGELFGAFELINKQGGHFTAEDETALVELAAYAAVALENAQDRQQLIATSRQLTEQAAQQVQLIGESPAIEALRSTIRRVADTDLAVLILGENGTGKEVVAQSIHYLSRRRDHPFVAVNCAAIPETLAESELFGHEKGAFTDAHQARPGKFELAGAGTLFLDEIGDLSLGSQAKLLRVLEQRLFVRVGGSLPIPTDARIIAATNQDLAEMVRQKRFREDLFYRLNVVTLEIPPLRDRPQDIMLLAEHFLGDFCKRARRKVPVLTPAARHRLQTHPWPGNVRELRNLMERLAYLTPQERIDADDLAFILAPRRDTPGLIDPDRPLNEATARFQIDYIRQAIQRAGGNISKAAEQLGLHRSNLYRKMRQLERIAQQAHLPKPQWPASTEE